METSVIPTEELPAPSVLDNFITAEEIEELGDILLSCDADGMLDIGELDGFLSALSIAPRVSALERWWAALVGHQPEWDSPAQAARARTLVERYYGMVQARVALAPAQLGFAAVPPLWSSVEDFDEQDDVESDDNEDPYGELVEVDEGDDELIGVSDDSDDFDEPAPWLLEHAANDEADSADEGDLIVGDDSDEPYAGMEHDDDDFDDRFEVGETWLSGFRYGLALQADDWRRVIETEPELAPWVYALWVAADGPANAEPIDDLPSLPPTAASPENAGFLALESTLKAHAAARTDVAAMVETHLVGVIPIVLHQLWRRNRQEAGPVAALIESDASHGELSQRDALLEELHDRLLRIAVPQGGMNLERLDGYWSALAAGPITEETAFSDLARVFGKTPAFDDERDARDTLQALMEFWNMIVSRQERAPQPEDEMCHVFIHFPDDSGDEPDRSLPYGHDWAKGFLEALEDFPRSAKLVLMDPEAKHWLAPIEAIAEGRSLEKRNARLDFDERMGLIVEIPECIAHLRGVWKTVDSLDRTPVRASQLPERNDPCPCGSGKKYKKCHGAPDRLN